METLSDKVRSLGLKGVRLLGSLEGPDLLRAYASADIFVFPSENESFGLAVLEAMATGLPVVCSDIPALRELVGDAGILVEPCSDRSWASAMVALVQDVELRRELGLRARCRARSHSWDEKVNRFESLARTLSKEIPS